MKWFDKLFKRSGSSPDDDDGEAGVHVHGHHFSHNGPHLFSVWNLDLLLFFFLVSFACLDLYRMQANGFRFVCWEDPRKPLDCYVLKDLVAESVETGAKEEQRGNILHQWQTCSRLQWFAEHNWWVWSSSIALKILCCRSPLLLELISSSCVPPWFREAFLVVDPDLVPSTFFCDVRRLQGLERGHHQMSMMSSWPELCRRDRKWRANPLLKTTTLHSMFLEQFQGMHAFDLLLSYNMSSRSAIYVGRFSRIRNLVNMLSSKVHWFWTLFLPMISAPRYGQFLRCLGKNWHPHCFCCWWWFVPIWADKKLTWHFVFVLQCVSSNCAGCNQPLGYGQFLSCLGKNWHPNCFCCGRCNKPISESEVLIALPLPFKQIFRLLFLGRQTII